MKITDYIGNSWLGQPIRLIDDPWYRFSRAIDILEQTSPIEPESTWLDVGCHQGELLEVLHRRNRTIGTGIDDWDGGPNVGSSAYFRRDIDIDGFGLDSTFHYISAMEVLEHMIDTDKFLRQCHTRLADDGLLLISTPNINSLRNRVMVPFGAYPNGLEYRDQIRHVRLYNCNTLVKHLREHGFDVIGIRGVSFLPVRFLGIALLRALSNVLADVLPQLCGNIIVVSRKIATEKTAEI